jgi:hypothetical protein
MSARDLTVAATPDKAHLGAKKLGEPEEILWTPSLNAQARPSTRRKSSWVRLERVHAASLNFLADLLSTSPRTSA